MKVNNTNVTDLGAILLHRTSTLRQYITYLRIKTTKSTPCAASCIEPNSAFDFSTSFRGSSSICSWWPAPCSPMGRLCVYICVLLDLPSSRSDCPLLSLRALYGGEDCRLLRYVLPGSGFLELLATLYACPFLEVVRCVSRRSTARKRKVQA